MLIKTLPVGQLETNCYVVTDEDSLDCAVIDPGDESGTILDYLEDNKLHCRAVLLTHAHFDHVGAANALLEATGARLYMCEKELELVKGGASGRFTVPEDVKYYRDGDTVEVGGLRFEVMETPGHTPGHICLYDREECVMFLGDHVLFDITPNITNWEGVDDSLGNYLDSLRAIRAYDVALPLPGHRGRGAFRARIDDLLAHHEHRLAEALEVVKKYPGNTAYFLAGHMTWKIRANSWEEFPLAQKWFAVGECASHMDYLKRRDLIREEPDGEGLLRYYPC